MSLGHALLQQCRKPSGWLGGLILRSMNRSHHRVTDWGLTHATIAAADTVLDVGCGGGRTVHKLAARTTQGRICGIDFSAASVAAARRTNRRDVARGRVQVDLGDVSHLPYGDATFDLVTAVETHYYWPDLPADVREARRVLKPGGTFLLIAETYRGGKYDALLRRLDRLRGVMQYALLCVEEHRGLLAGAGFEDVQVVEEYERGWICARGTKPG